MVETKSQIMRRIASGLAFEAFAHDTLGSFHVTEMRARAWRGDYELCRTSLYPDQGRIVRFLMDNRDWEPERVWELLNDPAAPWEDPALMLLCPEGDHVLVDGIHRIIARWALRCANLFFYMVPLAGAPRVDQTRARTSFDWGRFEVRADGHLYDRATGDRFRGRAPGG